MMRATVYRKTAIKVELSDLGTVRQVTTDYPERDLTELLTDYQKHVIAFQVRHEIEEENR